MMGMKTGEKMMKMRKTTKMEKETTILRKAHLETQTASLVSLFTPSRHFHQFSLLPTAHERSLLHSQHPDSPFISHHPTPTNEPTQFPHPSTPSSRPLPISWRVVWKLSGQQF
ncbi:hypothetical protein BLNAU_22701 [Blattamonas nauphoetae]|uniref:Uncharacterized protein n=1 Tax=Blattamonas nauphoetae TaxID=2049346 RepID=A0ABQ9WSC8_9EUKA|nr:hypothetical protein BLNAU_22701 [Blattamonas nauphoetae]